MPYDKDPRVDAYLEGLPEWQREICSRVRDLVHAADADVVETIKRRIQPYFVLDGNVCALLAAKDHVNVFLYDGAMVSDPEGIITGGHDNKTARTIAFQRDAEINERALVTMFRQIIANNRAGGWRKLKGGGNGDTFDSDRRSGIGRLRSEPTPRRSSPRPTQGGRTAP